MPAFPKNGGSAVGDRFPIVEATLRGELAKPYVYGRSDCFMLGIAMIDALSGSDLRSKYEGCYTTLLGAQLALRRRRHKTLSDLFAKHLEPIAPAMAQMGDLVILRLPDGEHVGICLGARFVTKGERGRSLLSLSDCIAAFRIQG
jgi:hypothetical protein